jgi:GT2 family glycosyltransferase
MVETRPASGGVTVAIVTREPNRDFEECISCTQTQTLAPSEVIVVAGSASVGSESRWPYATYIVSTLNRSAARNLAWKKAASDTVCFWESDSVFSDNWIEEVMKGFSDGAHAVIDRRRCHEPSTYFQECWDRQFDIRYSRYTPFSAWAFRRSVLEATGGYDENLEYAEDSDLGSRILQEGFKIRLAKEAIQYHKGEPGSFVDLVRRRYRFGRNKALGYYRKHLNELPRARILASILGPVSLACLALAGWPLLAVVVLVASPCLLATWIYLRYRSLVGARQAPGIALARILGGISYHWGTFVGLLTRRLRSQ